MCCYNDENPDCGCDYECDMCSYYDDDCPEEYDDEETSGECAS